MIKEIFNKVYPWKDMELGLRGEKSFLFMAGDGKTAYEVMVQDASFSDTQLVPFSFHDRLSKILQGHGYRFHGNVTHVTFKKVTVSRNTMGISPTKNFVSVLSTVIDILQKNTRENDAIIFSAEEPSRKRLYDTLVNKFKRPNDDLEILDAGGKRYYLLLPKIDL